MNIPNTNPGCRFLSLLIMLFLLQGVDSYGQQKTSVSSGEKESASKFRDTLDGKFDFSPFLLEPQGFFPLVSIITEPALGGFGLALVPLFLAPKTDPSGRGKYIPPDMTMIMGMYTANKSWAAGAGRIGSFPKIGLKYRIFTAYGNINMSYYREDLSGEEREFKFRIKSFPIMLSASKEIGRTDLYAGLQYQYMNAKIAPRFSGDLPGDIETPELNSHTSALGLFLDYDKRNSVFTPDRGGRLNAMFTINDKWTGSDYDFRRLNFSSTWFFPFKPTWISGFRFDLRQIFGDAPFYLLPGIEMRGIPAARYQGTTTFLVETEQRLDLNLRWSIVGFAGIGQTYNNKTNLIHEQTVWSAGGGFRYLIARMFNMRTGIDIGFGPDSWGWYIVFGHNWNR